MASFRRRNGRWQVQIRKVGHQARTRTFSNKSDALAWAKQVEHCIDVGDVTSQDRVIRTLDDLLEKYEAEVIPMKRTDSGESFMLRAIRKHPISSKQLRHIRAQDFAHLRDELLRRSRPSTVVRKLSVLRHALAIAHSEWGWSAPVLEFAKVRLPAVAVPAIGRISDQDFCRLLEAARSQRSSLVSLAVQLALGTAMRRGELLNLRWEDVDLERRALTIRTAKNGRGRVIPITEDVRDILGAQGEQVGHILPISCNALKLGFQRAKSKARTAFRFHDLRHEAISRFFELGLTVPEVQLISGHRTLSQLSRYAHPDVARVAAKLGNT